MVGSTETRGIAHVVDVEKLDIVNHQDEVFDLRAVFTEIEITSSIFEPGIHGTITVYDAIGLINQVPIVGEERIRIRYRTPENRPKEGEFIVWRLTDEHPDEKGNSSVYRLHFCSPEMIWNARNTVSKSYPQTDEALSIVNDLMITYLRTRKELRTRDTVIKDPAKILVIPSYKPFEAIDMVRRRAYTEDGSSNYFLFFERWDYWYFTTLDQLVAQPINNRSNDAVEGGSALPNPEEWSKDYWTYASDKFQLDSVNARDIRRINIMRIVSRFNSLEKVEEGAYDNEVVQYSIIDKEVTSKTFNFLQDFNVLMGGSKDTFATASPRGNYEKERPNTDRFLTDTGVVDLGYAGAQSPKAFFRLKDPEEKPDIVKKSGLAYQSIKVLLEQIRISITVPGDTMVDIGDIIHLVIPRFDSLGKAEPDKFLYGKYIVANLRDSILVPDKHTMSVDLHRDGFWQKIGPSDLNRE